MKSVTLKATSMLIHAHTRSHMLTHAHIYIDLERHHKGTTSGRGMLVGTIWFGWSFHAGAHIKVSYPKHVDCVVCLCHALSAAAAAAAAGVRSGVLFSECQQIFISSSFCFFLPPLCLSRLLLRMLNNARVQMVIILAVEWYVSVLCFFSVLFC